MVNVAICLKKGGQKLSKIFSKAIQAFNKRHARTPCEKGILPFCTHNLDCLKNDTLKCRKEAEQLAEVKAAVAKLHGDRTAAFDSRVKRLYGMGKK